MPFSPLAESLFSRGRLKSCDLFLSHCYDNNLLLVEAAAMNSILNARY